VRGIGDRPSDVEQENAEIYDRTMELLFADADAIRWGYRSTCSRPCVG
jgi:hypothetical protein